MSDPQSQMLEMVEQMPAFPASVQRILAMTSNVNVAPKDLVQVIDHDPVLTMRILKVVNSAYYGLSKPIVSVKHAVVYIGINTILSVAVRKFLIPGKRKCRLPVRRIERYERAAAPRRCTRTRACQPLARRVNPVAHGAARGPSAAPKPLEDAAMY